MVDQINLPPFRLYGLMGCPHCLNAERFLRSRQCPVIVVIANDDPIALAGVQAAAGTSDFPVLCYTPEKTIIKGFNEGEYGRVVQDYRARLSAGLFDVPTGEQLIGPQAEAPLAPSATGAI